MSSIVLVTESGERHGLINELVNSVRDDGFKSATPENKTKMEKLKKEESRMVKARYINHRGMHERLSKPYMHWAGDSIKMYHLIPGQVYDLPLGFVKEINDSPGLADRGEKMVGDEYQSKDKKGFKIHELVPIHF
jgi:hypothetical protein